MAGERFCAACGSPLALREVHGARRQVCTSQACGRVAYQNSKPCVGGIILRDREPAAVRRVTEVLLSRRARDPKAGLWDLPGGFLEAGEHPDAGLARELEEETGLKLRRAELLGMWMGTYGAEPTLNLLYTCEAEGTPHAADDSAELRWWPLDALPRELAWPHEGEALRRLAEQGPA